jgi:uncharacterized protein YfeS
LGQDNAIIEIAFAQLEIEGKVDSELKCWYCHQKTIAVSAY